jgi:hypothetical protein
LRSRQAGRAFKRADSDQPGPGNLPGLGLPFHFLSERGEEHSFPNPLAGGPPCFSDETAAETRCGADQATADYVGSRCDREAPRHCPEFGLPRAHIGGANRRAFSRWQLVRPGLQSAGYAAAHIARPIADRDAQPPRALAKTIPHLARGWLSRLSRHRGPAPPPNKS